MVATSTLTTPTSSSVTLTGSLTVPTSMLVGALSFMVVTAVVAAYEERTSSRESLYPKSVCHYVHCERLICIDMFIHDGICCHVYHGPREASSCSMLGCNQNVAGTFQAQLQRSRLPTRDGSVLSRVSLMFLRFTRGVRPFSGCTESHMSGCVRCP